METWDDVREVLPVTVPFPTPDRVAGLWDEGSLEVIDELSRNPDQRVRWKQHLDSVLEHADKVYRDSRGQSTPVERAVLGDKLAAGSSSSSRLAFQQVVDVYERAISANTRSYKLWRDYLAVRSSYVLGTPSKPLKLNAPKKKRGDDGTGRSMSDWLQAGHGDHDELDEGERDMDSDYSQPDQGIDPVAGWDEWRALAATFERALMWLPNLPRIWLMYLQIFDHPKCPSVLCHTHARKTYDRALRTLPHTVHERIWRPYLRWAQAIGGQTSVRVWRRYLAVDKSPTGLYIQNLLKLDPEPRPLEAAKLLLDLFRRTAKGEYKSPEGKSAYQYLADFLDVVEKFADQVGIDLDETNERAQQRKQAADEINARDEERRQLVRQAEANGDEPPAFDPEPESEDVAAIRREEQDSLSEVLLDVEGIIRTEGLDVYVDQAGRLWTGLATYWIKRGEFDHARSLFEQGIATVVTLRDFTQIFDSYAEFEESYISTLMDGLADNEDDEEQRQEDEKEMDERMQKFEELMDRRPFLVNEVLLRRNVNDVQEWEKRVALYGTDDEKVAETYTKATKQVNPRKATPGYHLLWIHFAKFYEQGGASGEAEPDIASARKIFDKATQAAFRKVDELAEVWIEWSEMEVRNENYDDAVRVMQRATQVPKKAHAISFHDEKLSAQQRLFKSLKLWSYYVDLEESIGTVETTKSVYDKMLELKIANAQIVINYANFLEENEYWEESFKVYERGTELFTYPVVFEIWNAYLSKFIKRYGGDKIERARDLFEQALDKCPPKFCKPLYLLYGSLEEEHGLAKRAMAVYDRATRAVDIKDRMEMYTYYIAKATANFGLAATRPIYERAIEVLPDKHTAEMCIRYAALERKLGEIDRARAIYAHASQFCDPRTMPAFWETWNAFEIETGSEDTFREYLRIKRAVQASFNTEASYLAARAQQAKAGVTTTASGDSSNAQEAAAAGLIDPMEALDREARSSDQALGGAFVRSKETIPGSNTEPAVETVDPAANADEIALDDDDEEE